MKELPANPSESFKRRNPHLYGAALGGLATAERKQDPKPALDKNPQAQHRHERSVNLCVTLIACRKRILDDDNSIAGYKCLRDAVARRLGIDDADPRVRWEYGQVRSDKPGTIVRIDLL